MFAGLRYTVYRASAPPSLPSKGHSYLGEPGEAAEVAPVEPITAEAVRELNARIARAKHSPVFAPAEEPLLIVQNQLRAAA